jgi:hypothetical protein
MSQLINTLNLPGMNTLSTHAILGMSPEAEAKIDAIRNGQDIRKQISDDQIQARKDISANQIASQEKRTKWNNFEKERITGINNAAKSDLEDKRLNSKQNQNSTNYHFFQQAAKAAQGTGQQIINLRGKLAEYNNQLNAISKTDAFIDPNVKDGPFPGYSPAGQARMKAVTDQMRLLDNDDPAQGPPGMIQRLTAQQKQQFDASQQYKAAVLQEASQRESQGMPNFDPFTGIFGGIPGAGASNPTPTAPAVPTKAVPSPPPYGRIKIKGGKTFQLGGG